MRIKFKEELKALLGLGDAVMKVRSDMEPLEQQEQARQANLKRIGLEDGDYKAEKSKC